MHLKRNPYRVFLAMVMIGLLAGCTDNPFESDTTIATSTRRVHGKVQLSNTTDHNGVYVWLEGFDLSAATDEEGNFSITLPPPEAQVSGGGEGVFRIWTFLGNYRLGSARAAVHDGSFVFPSTDFQEDGQLREPIVMQELFSINTVLSMTRIEADSPRFIAMQVELRSSAPPVDVYFPRMYAGKEGPVLLRNLRTGEVEIYQTVVTGIEVNDYVRVGDVPYVRSLLLTIPKYALRAGQYEIIPYLLPHGQYIPVPLLNSLGEDVTALGPGFAAYPYRREGGRLDVTPN
jgi:hypothetical protein